MLCREIMWCITWCVMWPVRWLTMWWSMWLCTWLECTWLGSQKYYRLPWHSMDLYTDSLLAFRPPAAKVVSDIYMPLKTYAEAVKKTLCRAPCPALSTSSATSTLSTASLTSSKNKYKCCHKCQKMGHIRQECPYCCRVQVCFCK